MKYALFLGCNIPARVRGYEFSARAVLKRLKVELVDIRQFNCCGYPLRNIDPGTFLLSATRNLALAEEKGLNMLILCQCCYGSLKNAQYIMQDNGDLQNDVHRLLAKDGLKYSGTTQVKHLLSVLYHDVGVDVLKSHISLPYKDLKIASHYGCHALRPSEITQFDNAISPHLLDELVEITGARSVDWRRKLDCCGGPLLGINDELSLNLTKNKVTDGKKAGANYLCTACPYCQIQFDWVQHMIVSENGGGEAPLPSLVYPQLLGLSMGIEGEKLRIHSNQLDVSNVIVFLNRE